MFYLKFQSPGTINGKEELYSFLTFILFPPFCSFILFPFLKRDLIGFVENTETLSWDADVPFLVLCNPEGIEVYLRSFK